MCTINKNQYPFTFYLQQVPLYMKYWVKKAGSAMNDGKLFQVASLVNSFKGERCEASRLWPTPQTLTFHIRFSRSHYRIAYMSWLFYDDLVPMHLIMRALDWMAAGWFIVFFNFLLVHNVPFLISTLWIYSRHLSGVVSDWTDIFDKIVYQLTILKCIQWTCSFSV